MKLSCSSWLYLLAILLVLNQNNSFAYKSKELDSLILVLDNYSKKDTAYLKTLVAIALKARNEDFEQAIEYFEQAIDLSRKIPDVHQEIIALNGMGVTFGMQDKYQKAIQYFNEALQLALSNKFPQDAAISYNSLGIVYKRMGEYPTSLTYYTKSIQIYQEAGNEEGIASANHNLGVLFDMMKEQDKALDYYNKAIVYYQKTDQESAVHSLQTNIAILHLGKGEFEKAIQLFSAALNFYEGKKMVYAIANTRSNLGHTYYKMGELNRAEAVLWPALKVSEEYNLVQLKCAILYNLSKIKAEKGNFSQSLALAMRSKVVADSTNSTRSKSEAAELLSFVYQKAGDAEKALGYFKTHKLLEDSIFNENKSRSYKNQQVIMEVYEKDKQLEAQTIRLAFLNRQVLLENRWKWTLGIASIFLLVAGSGYYQKYRQGLTFSRQLKSKHLLIIQQKKEIEEINLQLEKRMLRAQMNPHFIFNALSSIQHFIITNEKVTALHYLSYFSTMLRQILETSVNVNMVLKDEIELIKIYLELEALRFDNDFDYVLNISDDLDLEMLEIPTMIIQPFVENAILHGLMPKKNNRKLTIDLENKGLSIVCTVTDNGIGRKEAAKLNSNKIGKSPSRGISVTRQRLELLAKNYGLKTEILYVDMANEAGKATGTKVIINIPKQDL